MQEGPDPGQLKSLEDRIEAVKRATAPKPPAEEHYSAASQGWRMVIELVSGLGIGFGIGYGLDTLLGTLPWLMLLFTMLGFVAGVKTMLRTATEIQNSKAAQDAAKLHLLTFVVHVPDLVKFGAVDVPEREMKQQIAAGKNAQFLLQYLGALRADAFEIFDVGVEGGHSLAGSGRWR